MREIVQRYQQKLYRFQYQMIGSHEDTEDAVMDVFLRVWQQAERFEARASFATWLYRIAANVACDLLRTRKGQCQTTPLTTLEYYPSAGIANAEESALNNMEREERARQFQQALQQLSIGDRLLLTLYYTEEMAMNRWERSLNCPIRS